MSEKKLIDIEELSENLRAFVSENQNADVQDYEVQLAIAEQTEALVAVNTRIAEALELITLGRATIVTRDMKDGM